MCTHGVCVSTSDYGAAMAWVKRMLVVVVVCVQWLEVFRCFTEVKAAIQLCKNTKTLYVNCVFELLWVWCNYKFYVSQSQFGAGCFFRSSVNSGSAWEMIYHHTTTTDKISNRQQRNTAGRLLEMCPQQTKRHF